MEEPEEFLMPEPTTQGIKRRTAVSMKQSIIEELEEKSEEESAESEEEKKSEAFLNLQKSEQLEFPILVESEDQPNDQSLSGSDQSNSQELS